ncbi:MAG: hypothetical protein Q9P14_15970 [candidate division KSB1 bacterium]|nr:hypothetical protein [candidate division KSB1 bacterium]
MQSHIDHLKAVFFSSFALYPPMPYVLEECLYRVYLNKGWNLITSTNRRGVCAEAYPTLDDLYNQIAPVVERLGYEERLAMDIRAALETRINSLRLGAKGLMLNTRQVPDLDRLFRQPTVLELKYVGNEDEKAFLMGLIFMLLYEYREARAGQPPADGLHLLVIEEAHRLLRNTDRQRRSDEANTRAEAIEAFSNMLAEIRAYGQGVIIADQIPSHLAPEVLKNTNLKIAHRTVAFDERETLGQAMVCNDKQRLHLARLRAGEAVLYQEGMDAPNLIRVHLLEANKKLAPDNQQLRAALPRALLKPGGKRELLHGEKIEQLLYQLQNSDQAFYLVAKIFLSVLANAPPPWIMTAFLEANHAFERLEADHPPNLWRYAYMLLSKANWKSGVNSTFCHFQLCGN